MQPRSSPLFDLFGLTPASAFLSSLCMENTQDKRGFGLGWGLCEGSIEASQTVTENAGSIGGSDPLGKIFHPRGFRGCFVLLLSKEEKLHGQQKATLLYPKGISAVPSQQTVSEGLARELTQCEPQTPLLSLLCAGSGHEPHKPATSLFLFFFLLFFIFLFLFARYLGESQVGHCARCHLLSAPIKLPAHSWGQGMLRLTVPLGVPLPHQLSQAFPLQLGHLELQSSHFSFPRPRPVVLGRQPSPPNPFGACKRGLSWMETCRGGVLLQETWAERPLQLCNELQAIYKAGKANSVLFWKSSRVLNTPGNPYQVSLARGKVFNPNIVAQRQLKPLLPAT